MSDTRALAEELREYTAMKYAGDCKCGKCQLVPRALVERVYHTLNGSTFDVAQGWRLIDTAPLNGKRILLFQRGRGAFEGWWKHEWPDAEAYWTDDADSEPAPTHWQPLLAEPGAAQPPAAPVETEPKNYWTCCHCDAPLSCAACGIEQPNDSEYYREISRHNELPKVEVERLKSLSPCSAGTDLVTRLFDEADKSIGDLKGILEEAATTVGAQAMGLEACHAEIARLRGIVKAQGEEVRLTREADEAKDKEIARLRDLPQGASK